MEVHIFESQDIYLNLALEQELFMSLPQGKRRLLIWKNRPAVVMGRFQNPWIECNLAKMKARKVDLARRQSGGGTVYHDQGNLNISFLDWNENYDKEINNRILVRTLRRHGHNASTSGRSDIIVREGGVDKKVSGAAFKKKKDRSFHHCTMLLNANLDLLNEYLRPKLDASKVESKSIASVRSKVANTEIREEVFVGDLIREYEAEYGGKAKVCRWSEEQANELVPQDHAYLVHLRSWEWRYGETPLFKTSIELNGWSLEVSVKKARIKALELAHDGVHPSFLSELGQAFIDCYLKEQDILRVFEEMPYRQAYMPEVEQLKSVLKEVFTL